MGIIGYWVMGMQYAKAAKHLRHPESLKIKVAGGLEFTYFQT